MLAAIPRKDYDDPEDEQAQGITKAEGRYRGRPEGRGAQRRNSQDTPTGGQSWSSIVAATGASRSTLSRLAKRVNAPEVG